MFFYRLRNRVLLLLFICSAAINAFAYDGKRVSVLTCSPGEEVYELFGHTALRVTDSENGADLVFNYGLFSFDEPNFIWRFVLGETDYLLGVADYNSFMAQYEARGSGVTEQVLNLDSAQVMTLLQSLYHNIQPDNRKYRYNFLFNNCTTKARDVVFDALGAPVSYAASSAGDSLSFRQIVHRFTVDNPWYSFGMDLLLGAPADVIAGRNGAQFAPILFKEELTGAYVVKDSIKVPLLSEHGELLMPRSKVSQRNNLTPFNVALLLLLFTFVVMLCERRSKKTYWLWDVLLMGLQGLSGCVLLFMVLFSQHPAVDVNWLLLWINPISLFLLPVLIYKIRKDETPYIMFIQLAMAAIFILLSPILPQAFPAPVYIVAVALIVRSLFHLYKKNICALD